MNQKGGRADVNWLVGGASLSLSEAAAKREIHSKEICNVIEENGWKLSEPQSSCISNILQGNSIVFISNSHESPPFYSLAIMELLLREPRSQFCLCLLPHKEAVKRQSKAWMQHFSHLQLRSVCLSSTATEDAAGFQQEVNKLSVKKATEKPHIIFATLESCESHRLQGSVLRLASVRHVVIDSLHWDVDTTSTKCQELISSLKKDVTHIHLFLDKKTPEAKNFIEQHCSSFICIEAPQEDDDIHHEEVDSEILPLPGDISQHHIAIVPEQLKEAFLIHLFRLPKELIAMERVLVVTSRWRDAIRLNDLITTVGVSASCVYGQMDIMKRKKEIERFHLKEIRVLVTTELPIAEFQLLTSTQRDWLVNMDVPTSAASYIHHASLLPPVLHANVLTLVSQYTVFHLLRLEMSFKHADPAVLRFQPVDVLSYKDCLTLADEVRLKLKEIDEKIRTKEDSIKKKSALKKRNI